jgi:hypothetical protein
MRRKEIGFSVTQICDKLKLNNNNKGILMLERVNPYILLINKNNLVFNWLKFCSTRNEE